MTHACPLFVPLSFIFNFIRSGLVHQASDGLVVSCLSSVTHSELKRTISSVYFLPSACSSNDTSLSGDVPLFSLLLATGFHFLWKAQQVLVRASRGTGARPPVDPSAAASKHYYFVGVSYLQEKITAKPKCLFLSVVSSRGVTGLNISLVSLSLRNNRIRGILSPRPDPFV